MSSKNRHLTYLISALAIGATLIVASPIHAENPTTVDLSTQPHLKAWSNIIPNAAKRFVVLADFNSEAVLDRETGLVWEKSLTGGVGINWAEASFACINKNVGGRKAWRLPSIVELLSLVDPIQSNPALPLGHPFSGLQSIYWSATTIQDLPTFVWGVGIQGGSTTTIDKSSTVSAWCVRSPMQESLYGANP